MKAFIVVNLFILFGALAAISAAFVLSPLKINSPSPWVPVVSLASLADDGTPRKYSRLDTLEVAVHDGLVFVNAAAVLNENVGPP
jgi:hypothetical protein